MSATLGTMRVAAPPAGSSIARKIEASEAQLLVGWVVVGGGSVESAGSERDYFKSSGIQKARSKPKISAF